MPGFSAAKTEVWIALDYDLSTASAEGYDASEPAMLAAAPKQSFVHVPGAMFAIHSLQTSTGAACTRSDAYKRNALNAL
jgi:hypothetical protein